MPIGRMPSSKSRPKKAHCVLYTESTINEVQRIIRGRLFFGDKPMKLNGLEEQKSQVLDLIKRCAEAGESNSLLLVGPRGSGKTLVLNSALENIRETRSVKKNLLEVHLNGLVQTDDRSALLEITRQLQLENTVGDKVFGSFAENLAFLLDALKSGGAESQSVLFMLDEFDLFAHHKNQTLLYNLFDISQSAQAPICVIGLTCRLDVVELLEKRVKSRFSHRQIHVSNAHKFEDYLEIVRSILLLPPSFSDKSFSQAWKENVEALLQDGTAQDVLKRQYNVTKDITSLHNLLAMPVCSLSCTHPFLQSADLEQSYTQKKLDCKAAMLHGVSVLELCLIIAMRNLVRIHDGDSVNFEMVYREYQKFTRGKGHATQSFEKPVVLKAFEHLVVLEFVKPLDSCARHTPKEFQLVTFLVDHSQVMDALQQYPDCPTEVKHWASTFAMV